MVYKLLVLIFFLGINIGYTNIIYDKNNIIITDIEINNYKELYKTNFGGNISNNQAIKNIVLIKRSINFLLKNNEDFIFILDQNIESEYGKEVFNNQSLLNFIRFQKIRNEFVSEYFKNIFSIEDLEIIFSNLNSLRLPISKNNCSTIDKIYEVINDKYFIESFFRNLKDKNQKIKTSINNQLFDVCLDNKSLKNIESEIIKFIENKIENNFNKFVYRK